ncbi:MAG: hypothetical protein KatS3mg123_2292 [Burkholderiales bacterium]|nr:MAG: hypothetical protein KatS3mg123_2292 [Burkholderiales bacterium]
MTGRGAPRRGVKKASERLTCVKPHSLNKSGSPRARSAHHGLGSALAHNSPFIALASVMAFPLSGGGPWCSESPSLVLPGPDDGRGAPDAPDDVRGRGPAGPPGSEGAALDRGDPDDRRRAFLRRDAVAGRSLRPVNPDGRETARFLCPGGRQDRLVARSKGSGFEKQTAPRPGVRRCVPDLDPGTVEIVKKCKGRRAGRRFALSYGRVPSADRSPSPAFT